MLGAGHRPEKNPFSWRKRDLPSCQAARRPMAGDEWWTVDGAVRLGQDKAEIELCTVGKMEFLEAS